MPTFTSRFAFTLLAALAMSACSRNSDVLLDSTHAPSLSADLCSDINPSPEQLAQFIDAMHKHNAPFVSRVQTLRLRESAREAASPSTSHAPNQAQGITLRHDMGDTFPTLLFPANSAGPLEVRLDPFLRNARMDNISRIAISPDARRVAVIARARLLDDQAVLIIDRTLSAAKLLTLSAYDLSWLGNDSLLISTLTEGRPKRLWLYQHDAEPRLIHSSQRPADEVLLASHSATKHAFIEVRSPTASSIFALDPASPSKLHEVLQDDLPGASCTFWLGNYTCLSFKHDSAGEVVILSRGAHRVLTKGSRSRPIVRISADQRYLRLFFSTGTASIVQIFESTSKPPVTAGPLGPVTTVYPATSFARSGSSLVTTRSFLNPSRTLPDSELVGAHTTVGRILLKDTTFSSPYSEEALSIPSTDGVAVPVSLVRPRDVRGLFIHAYGAYGIPSYSEYSSEVMTLLEHGIAVAVVHVRGGGELGPQWHIDGSGSRKSRAVNDLISSTQQLQRHLGVSPQKTILRGRSAGGWLVARVAMTSRNLLAGIILDAPLLHLEAAVSSSDSPLFHRDVAEWGSAEEARQLSAVASDPAFSFPFHIFVSVPMRDVLIPPAETIFWALQARCKQPRGSAMVLHTLPTAGHTGPTTTQDARALEALQIAFVTQIIAAPVTGQ